MPSNSVLTLCLTVMIAHGISFISCLKAAHELFKCGVSVVSFVVRFYSSRVCVYLSVPHLGS